MQLSVTDGVQAVEAGTFKKWIKALGKEKDCKGKRLFMPVRIALTGQTAGPDVGELLTALALDDGTCKVEGFARLEARMEILRECVKDM
jgi:glutamyl/glutaminyl-tRNA synthetase